VQTADEWTDEARDRWHGDDPGPARAAAGRVFTPTRSTAATENGSPALASANSGLAGVKPEAQDATHTMHTNSDARRRWFGMLFLALAAGMMIWGQTVLKERLTGVWYLLYWAGCGLLTMLAVVTALLDMWIVRRRAREEHRELLRRSFQEPGDAKEGVDESPARSNEKISHD
jgi:hypothetical protein